MKITIVTVGKLKEKFWVEAAKEYTKRLSAYCKLETIEVPDDDSKLISIVDKLSGYKISLCIEAKEFSSEAIAKKISSITLNGQSHIVFIIGGSTGLPEDIKRSSDFKLSFGKITLPHNLARVVLLEQIYRSFKIINGETYHK
ncbi:MAG: 23S rRNA (pseudouridine(1915)-N(3))-methyltransferase RlmH [Coriobacteriia bacterium]|nr:23S rRNA (pseudouridine(1915)-N(3))-methyltransferase RlmH [Coriobacteriia bacterium]